MVSASSLILLDSSNLRLLADGGSYLSATQNVTRRWDLLVIAQGGKKRQVDTGVVHIPRLKVAIDKLKMLDPSMGKRGRGLQFGSGKWEIRPLDYGAFI
jgi:hypothetical protein